MGIKQKGKTLKRSGNNLSDSFFQLKVLNGKELVDAKFPSFQEQLSKNGFPTLEVAPLEIFQLNIGKLCNQTCSH